MSYSPPTGKEKKENASLKAKVEELKNVLYTYANNHRTLLEDIWSDDVKPLEVKVFNLEKRLAAVEKERDEAIGSNDKEWCQLVESVLGWHPVGQTDFLRMGLSIDYRKLKADLIIAIKAIEKLHVGTDCNYCDANEKVLEEFNAS